MPRVSVIIPTFNCAQFILQAVDSALSQTYKDIEVIIVDDGSTDKTSELLSKYGKKINYFYQSNRGLSAARNLALAKASGEFIAYLDADDVWYPHKLERQVTFLDEHPDCGLVHSDVSIIDESNQIIYQCFNRDTRREVPQGYCRKDLLRWCHIQVPSVVERRECIEATETFDERLKVAQDYFHWLLVAFNGSAFGYIDEPLAMYRWRAGSLSRSQRALWQDEVTILEILLSEKSAFFKNDAEAADIVCQRLFTLRRDLAYLDRIEDRSSEARKRIIDLIREKPLYIDLYVDLIKACIPPALAHKLRLLREKWDEG